MDKAVGLCLALINKGMEIPEDIKSEALEMIQLRILACEDNATAFILETLRQAIENEDKAAISMVADLIEAAFPEMKDRVADRHPSKGITQEGIDALSKLSEKTIDAFVGPDDSVEARARVEILKKLNDELDVLPVKWADGLLVFCTYDADNIVVMQTQAGIGKSATARQFAELNKDEVYNAIRVAKGGGGTTNVHFLRLRWHLVDEGSLELMTLPLEEDE